MMFFSDLFEQSCLAWDTKRCNMQHPNYLIHLYKNKNAIRQSAIRFSEIRPKLAGQFNKFFYQATISTELNKPEEMINEQ